MPKPTAEPVTAGALPRVSSQIIRAAQAGVRTPISFQGKVVAAIVSAEDLATLNGRAK